MKRTLAPILMLILLAAHSGLLAQAPVLDVGVKVGQKIPPFRLPDQDGSIQDFGSVKGSKGTVLMFFRSADW